MSIAQKRLSKSYSQSKWASSCFFAVLLALIFHCNLAVGEKLYVYLPLEIQANKYNNLLSESCRSLEIVVFARSKDFGEKVAEDRPNLILALPPVVATIQNYKASIVGMKDGKLEEPYFLVSIRNDFDLSKLNSKKIGVVDLMGRKHTKAFVQKILNSNSQITQVTKIEDLLPILTFNAADAVFIASRTLSSLQRKTKLTLYSTPLNVAIGLPILAAIKDSPNAQVCFSVFSNEINAIAGVDKWQSL